MSILTLCEVSILLASFAWVHTQSLSHVHSLQLHGLQPTRFPCPWDPQARILEWVAISSSKGSSQPRDWMCISSTAGRFFTHVPPGKPLSKYSLPLNYWGKYLVICIILSHTTIVQLYLIQRSLTSVQYYLLIVYIQTCQMSQ